MNLILTRILWIRRSKWQFMLAGFAFFIGLSTLMIALEGYLQLQAALRKQHQSGQYLMLNKKVSMVNTIGLSSGNFEKTEIDHLRNSGLFEEVGEVHSNHFQAQVLASQYIQFQSFLFFEAVPRNMLDEPPAGFNWQEGKSELPIIVSQDFLNLYNFGFALGQGLPQLGRETLKMLNFQVRIDGPGGSRMLNGKVVGFTERIASVLVPEEFMQWANRTIGLQKHPSCNRVLVKVRNAASPEISRYLKKFRLSTDQEKMQMGKSGSLLDMLMKGLATLGLIFSMLALVMFATNFRLVMAEAEPDIRLLIELGYAHRRIAFQLLFWFGIFILLIFCGAVFLFLKGQALLGQAITGQGFGADPGIFGGTCLLAGFAFVFMVVLWNGILILNQLRKIA